jgi:hypothetical protein
MSLTRLRRSGRPESPVWSFSELSLACPIGAGTSSALARGTWLTSLQAGQLLWSSKTVNCHWRAQLVLARLQLEAGQNIWAFPQCLTNETLGHALAQHASIVQTCMPDNTI